MLNKKYIIVYKSIFNLKITILSKQSKRKRSDFLIAIMILFKNQRVCVIFQNKNRAMIFPKTVESF